MNISILNRSIFNTAILMMFGILSFSCTQAQKKSSTQAVTFPEAKSNSEWKEILSPAQYNVMVEKGTETPFRNAYNDNHEKGIYVSAATGKPLFSSEEKFESGTGWPSFSNPLNEEDVYVVQDNSFGMVRDEVVERATGLHLGHLFNDGPAPSNNRYCLNSAALKFIPESEIASLDQNQKADIDKMSKAYFASGCFWCVEAVYESVRGVKESISGYAGGHTKNPTYESSNTGKTGHAEAVEIIYDPSVISFDQLVDVYFGSQDPTQVNGQGPDRGSQYRSIIFYQNDTEKKIIEDKIKTLEAELGKTVAAEVMPFEKFWVAEDYHQNYEKNNPNNSYIRSVSIPRLKKFQKEFPELLKNGKH